LSRAEPTVSLRPPFLNVTMPVNDLIAEFIEMSSAGQAAAKQVKELEAKIATLEEAVTKAEAVGEQRRQEAQAATKRANDLVAELVEMTSELVEMSKRMAEQTAAMDKMRADFEDFRSRSWWWQHSTG
jgi:chromosome segregation ATPase